MVFLTLHGLKREASVPLLFAALSLTIVLSSAAPGFGQIPSLISYQGVLTDNSGNPENGSYPMQFALYNSSSGGNAVWTETQTVLVSNGIFNVKLGATNPIPDSLKFNSPYWLQVTVSGSALPRIELTSSAYSFNTSRIQGEPVSSTPPSSGQVLKWTGANWAPGTDNTGGGTSGTAGGDLSGSYPDPTVSGIQGKAVSSTSPSSGQVLKWNGTQWQPGADLTGGLSLPYVQTYSGSAGTAFSITCSGISGGISAYTDGNATALWGGTNSAGNAIYGINYGSGNAGYFSVDNTSSGGDAIYAVDNGTGYAGYFDGNVRVTGTLSKAGGSFEIDDPIDPANKILRHSFVESPDMMDVYNGNITTDASGTAVVQLPDYFDALNENFKYQLTVIGQFAQAIVAKEIQNNQFTIKTNKPDVKVSWQVTGIRKDPWAEKHRIVVEQEKSAKTRGYYLNPRAYGLPETRSVEWALHPQMMEQLEADTSSVGPGRRR